MANTALSANKDIDYIQKDFNSSVDALINFANVNFGPGTSANRLWTNFNVDSFSRNWLEIVAFMSDAFFFYFDSQATQSYLQTATIRSAVTDIAKQFGFVPDSAASASGQATFTFTGAGTISRGFRVKATNGEEFFVTNDVVAGVAGDFKGTVLQGIIKNEQFVSEGLQNEEFELAGPNVVRDTNNSNPADLSPQVTVGGNEYTIVDTLITHSGEDVAPTTDSLGNVIGGGGRVFTLDERDSGTPFIRFGDGIFGRQILPGEVVDVTYRTGGGTAGNIGEETLVTLVDSLVFVSSVTNESDFSGGADEQTIEQLRELIPQSLRTLDRAVTDDDYSELLITNFSEVFTASTEANNEDIGIDLNVFVIPQGSGIQAITDNPLLVTNLSTFLDRRKMVTVQFAIADAFGIDTLIGLEIFIIDTASKQTIRESVTTALLNFFSLTTGGADGAGIGFAEPVLIRNICEILDNISGIDRFEIKQLTYRPRIDDRVVGLLTEYSFSDVSIFTGVEELEWLLAASGQLIETAGGTNFSNDALIPYNYNSGTGQVTYVFPVDLRNVAAGDTWVDGVGATFAIFAIDTANNIITIGEGETVDNTVGSASSGSVLNGATTFQSFKVFRKIRGVATNLGTDSITDSNLDFSVLKSTGTILSSTVLLDNTKIFVPGEFATGEFYLVDASSNIWEILENDSNTLSTSVVAVNDASITTVASGDYAIVEKLVGSQIVIGLNVFNIQFNNTNTVFSLGGLFSQVAAIGDVFAVSEEQDNIGNLGVALDLVDFDSATGIIKLNGFPDLQGVNSNYVLVDSSGQSFNVTGTDNRSQPQVVYTIANRDDQFIMRASAFGSQVAQGFKVLETETYPVVSFNLKLEGNAGGNLTARIVNDDGGGLPDLGSPVANSRPFAVANVSRTGFDKASFTFVTPPTLAAGVQFHLVLTPDFAYSSSTQGTIITFDNRLLTSFGYTSGTGVIQYSGAVDLSDVSIGDLFRDSVGALFEISAVNDGADNVTIATGQTVDVTVPSTKEQGSIQISVLSFTNTGLVPFTYESITGRIIYDTPVDLSSVLQGHFFRDSAGVLFEVLAVDDSIDELLIAPSQAVTTTAPATPFDGAVFINDRVLMGTDTSIPSFPDGEFAVFNGLLWSNSSSGPEQIIDTDAIFSVEGTKTITIESNLTPTLGPGATATLRYYDDENQISLVLGIGDGIIISASDVIATGLGTIAGNINQRVDQFIFRTSRFADDIVNLRKSEIPQLQISDIQLDIFGGVE